jgi:hypothetical protein
MMIGECSDFVDTSIGSPQGSVFSPILFACFINDMSDHIRNCIVFIFMLTISRFILYRWVQGRESVGCSCQR